MSMMSPLYSLIVILILFAKFRVPSTAAGAILVQLVKDQWIWRWLLNVGVGVFSH